MGGLHQFSAMSPFVMCCVADPSFPARAVMGDVDEAKVIASELDFCKTKLEADGDRADALIKYTQSVQDPFQEGYAGENPWVSAKGGGGGGCVIL